MSCAAMEGMPLRIGSTYSRRGSTIVHVGGTNGKGSTVAMIAALAGTHGRVATYTSPHLSSLRERIAIDTAPIDEGAIVEAARAVHGAGGDRLTFFEQITAIACVAIADARVAVTVLEVGLGGRLDATNAIDAPIAVVTGVALDHEAILGRTLEAIAAEKGGIFKRGQRVVIGASGEPEAVPYLDRAARAAGASVITVIDDAAVAAVPPVGLAGAHQRRNAAAALAALDQLEVLGVVRVPPAARARALAGVRHPGRFEEIAGPPRIILDGAHNPHGARALAAVLAERGERPVLVAAVSADKDVAAIAAALAPAVRAVIATRYRQERSLDPAALAAAFREAARAGRPRGRGGGDEGGDGGGDGGGAGAGRAAGAGAGRRRAGSAGRARRGAPPRRADPRRGFAVPGRRGARPPARRAGGSDRGDRSVGAAGLKLGRARGQVGGTRGACHRSSSIVRGSPAHDFSANRAWTSRAPASSSRPSKKPSVWIAAASSAGMPMW